MRKSLKLMLLFSIITIVGFANNPSEKTIYNLVEKGGAAKYIYTINDSYCFYSNEDFPQFLSTVKLTLDDLAVLRAYDDKNQVDSVLVKLSDIRTKDLKTESVGALFFLKLNKDVKLDFQEFEKYK
ncbi:MAG: hypothetical protein R3Y26_08280 [Rikenellaceae bacterium]